jgi:hypothetical protein
MPDRPSFSAATHTVKVPANCMMMDVGTSLMRAVTSIESRARTYPATRLPTIAAASAGTT